MSEKTQRIAGEKICIPGFLFPRMVRDLIFEIRFFSENTQE
jgi:hypothetical protein